MKTLKKHLYKMLTENTGRHFLDSGGAYGRKWEQNQNIDFENEPRVTFDVYGNEVNETVNVYHYLSEVLAVDAISEKITKIIKDNDLHWTGEVSEYFSDNPLFWYKREYEEIKMSDNSINTYNYENNLSQVLQFITFKVFGNPYVILQIHGGCDVRGGYIQARCFKLTGYLTGEVDVYGTIDGVNVSNTYNGYSITDDNGNEIELTENSVISLDFCAMNEIYMYE